VTSMLPTLPAPPFSDRCYSCTGPGFVLPASRVRVGAWIRCEYRCPRCRHRWSSDLLAEYLGDCYSGGAG
jgi:hypothetical protein